jgi:hypothetical protein
MYSISEMLRVPRKKGKMSSSYVDLQRVGRHLPASGYTGTDSCRSILHMKTTFFLLLKVLLLAVLSSSRIQKTQTVCSVLFY